MKPIFQETETKYFFGSDQLSKSAKRTSGVNKADGKRTPLKTAAKTRKRTSVSKKEKLHRSKAYKFGDDSVLGGKLTPASSTSWLSGLSSEQIANLVSPDSRNGIFDMWVATNFPTSSGNEHSSKLREFFDSIAGKYGNLLSSVDYAAGKEELIYALESSASFKWLVENFGSPSFVGFSQKGGPAAVYDASFNFIAINMSEDVIKRTDNSYALKKDSDVIDNSTNSSIIHEWAHWLQNMCIRDTEFLGNQTSRIKNFFSGAGSRKYLKALSIAEKYDELRKSEFHGDESRSASSGPAINSYFGHVNGKEMLSEAVVAYTHPNTSISFLAMNDELRADVEAFLMIENGKRPWVD